MKEPYRKEYGCFEAIYIYIAPLVMLVLLLAPYIERVNEVFICLAALIYFPMLLLPTILFDSAIMVGYIAGAFPLILSCNEWAKFSVVATLLFLVFYIKYDIPDILKSNKKILYFTAFCVIFVALSTVSALCVL